MKNFHDLSSVVDLGYKLGEILSKGPYKEVVYYEFHKEVDGSSINNFESGFDLFRKESEDYYDCFISPGIVDDVQAEISIVVQINNQYFYSKDCGSNYYVGFGPGGILMLRKACTENNIICLASHEDIDDWLLTQSHGSAINLFHSPELEARNQFEKIMKAIRQFAIQIQRTPQEFNSLGEENLRNRLLAILNPIFDGRANGEAINGKGKTDILIRTASGTNENIFELKMWSGLQSLKNAIIQLSGYLSDHNHHCGLIFFYNKDRFDEVLKTISDYLKTEYGNISVFDKREFVFQISKISDSASKIETHLTIINLYC